MTEKSILEQALLQVGTLEEAVKQNAKGILSSVMKQELNDLLKESLEEEEEVAADEEVAEQPNPEEEEDDMSDEEEAGSDEEEAGDDDAENEDDLDNKDIDSLDSDEAGDDEMGDDELPELPSSDEGTEDDDVMDMTGASDDEVLKVFKAMKPEDGIVVKKDGDNVEFNDGQDEYIIKLDDEGAEAPQMAAEEDSMEEGGWNEEEEEEANEETIYEIEIDEEEEETNEGALKGLSHPKKVEAKESSVPGLSKPKTVEAKEEEEEDAHEQEVGEAARTKSNPHGNKGEAKRAGLPSKKTYKAGSGVFGINEEVETLKKQNSEYKKALVLFKEKLNEVAVFNANLAYATRLFTEHSTTKQEKMNILKRFDSISTMNESKNLFNTIKSELETKKPVTESVVEKISATPQPSASQEVLAEAKAYENPQFKRMKDLMSKIK